MFDGNGGLVTDQSQTDEPTSGRLIAVMPNRLAAPSGEDIRPLLGEPELVSALSVSDEWQRLASVAGSREVTAVLHGVQRDRMTEVIGITAAVGEQVALARAALVECEMWRLKRNKRDEVGDEMCHRAIVEMFSHFVLGAAHGLANLTARSLALDSTLHGPLLDRLGSTFPPHSNVRSDWISLDFPRVRALRRVAKEGRLADAQRLPEPVTTLVTSQEWRCLVDRRATAFHRRRLQSAEVTGVPLGSLWRENEPGHFVPTATAARAYSDTEGLAVATYFEARAAFRKLIGALTHFNEVRESTYTAIARHEWASKPSV